MTKKKRYTVQEIELATALHAQRKLSQVEIAKELKWTTSKVCRVLKAARDSHLWQETVDRTITDETLKKKADALLAEYDGQNWRKYKRLFAWLKELDPKGHLREVHVRYSQRELASKNGDDSPSAWDRSALEFGKQFAPVLHERLARSRLCAIGWGRTLRSLVRAITDLQLVSPWSDHGNRFFPVWGEVPAEAEVGSDVFFDAHELSSTKLAEDLHKLANADTATTNVNDDGFHDAGKKNSVYTVPDLRGALAMMPVRSFAENRLQRMTVKALMRSNPNYRMVFEQLVPTMDAALVGVGAFEQEGRALSGSVLEYSEAKDDIPRLFAGDVGGALIRRTSSPDSKPDIETELYMNTIELAWLGITRSDLYACAQRAADDNSKIGTLVCAVGRERTDTVLAALAASLCSELFIDDDLAKALEEKRKEFFEQQKQS